ncbi:hypothetical protein [Streptomyces sp. NPDC093261]|uniref:hypothetical protein n=1 Tax=Streptomyces sp. NPDC093261 TaxID=3366037 RepID=UPI003810C373
MSDNERPPNRRLVVAVYPAGTHLDYSRASSNAMRGNVRDDRDNSLIGQAELFDAPDRYADGYHDGYDHRSHDDEFLRYLADLLAREVVQLLGDLAYDAAARGFATARPRVNAWVRQRVDKLRSRSPRVAAATHPKPAQESGPEHVPPRPAAATAGHHRVDPCCAPTKAMPARTPPWSGSALGRSRSTGWPRATPLTCLRPMPPTRPCARPWLRLRLRQD